MKNKHKNNYHSHTYLCGHAKGNPIEYVNEAIKNNFESIGISEHAPMAMLRNINSRLTKEDYILYLKLLKEAKEYGSNNGIKVYSGLEIEYYKEFDFYQTFLNELDYLILGQHYIKRDGKYKSAFRFDDFIDVKLYVKAVIDGLESGYFKFLCHPELCLYNLDNYTDEMYDELEKIVDIAIKYDIPLEVNANGIRKSFKEHGKIDYNLFRYPNYKFFEMVSRKNAKVIIQSDAHKVEFTNDWALEEAYKFAQQLGLNVINKIEI